MKQVMTGAKKRGASNGKSNPRKRNEEENKMAQSSARLSES